MSQLEKLRQQVDSEFTSLVNEPSAPSLPAPPPAPPLAPHTTAAVPSPTHMPSDDFDMFGDDTPPPLLPEAHSINTNTSTATSATTTTSTSTTTSSNITSTTSSSSSSSSITAPIPIPTPASPPLPSSSAPSSYVPASATDMSHLTAKIGGKQAVAGDRDDEEGYYVPRIGEYLGPEKRYCTQSILGSGVFSCVVRAHDTRYIAPVNVTDASAAYSSAAAAAAAAAVAVKLIRANDRMKMSGEKELRILRHLASGKGNQKKYCITLLASLSHHHHLAIVTECMHQSLRKLLKLHPSGISIAAVRVYGKQLFSGLAYIHSLGVLHADLKLDNIVISEDKKRLKICDFGSALQSHELVAVRDTTELVSRFYRAPEIILGDTPTFGIDVWSGACCLFEMCTGHLPFMGDHNNGMLRHFMEFCGRFPKKVLTRSKHTSSHFNRVYDFVCQTDNTAIPGKSFGVRSLPQELMTPKERQAHRKVPGGNDIIDQVNSLSNLLSQMFALAPEKRLHANQALKEVFFRGKTRSTSSSSRR